MTPFHSFLIKISLSISIAVLTACHDDTHNEYSNHNYPIVQFDMVDTDGTNSSLESVYDLNISPYINNGHFELFWETRAYRNYSIDIRVNTWASLVGSQRVYSDTCGTHYLCDETPILYCKYQTNFDITCENNPSEAQIANIGHLLNNIPQTLYFILEVCDNDTGFCDFQALPVVME